MVPRKAYVWLALISLVFPSRLLTAADCNGNGQDDAQDVSTGASQDCNLNGIPDECEADLRFELHVTVPLSLPCRDYDAWPRDTPVVSGDLDADGDPDLVTANCGDWEDRGSTLSLLFNRGDGTFEPEIQVEVGLFPVFVVLADLDADQDLDIVSANAVSDDISVLLNTGNGAFLPPTSHSVAVPTDLAASDIDGDGDIDIAVGHERLVTFFLNTGNGEFDREYSYDVAPDSSYFRVHDLTLADVDADGDADLIVSEHDVVVWKNSGDGHFGAPLSYNLGEGNRGICWTHGLLSADLDLDGYPEIATADYTDGGRPSVSILGNRGDGTFRQVVPYYLDARDETQALAVADFNRDGYPDVAAVAGVTLCVLVNQGNGELSDSLRYTFDEGLYTALAEDLDGDGHTDLSVKERTGAASRLLVLRNEPPPGGCIPRFLRGDASGEGSLDISDAVVILQYLFEGTGELSCEDSADANDDGVVDISDALRTLFYLFLAGPAIPEPCADCGSDPTEDGLSCAVYPFCTQ